MELQINQVSDTIRKEQAEAAEKLKAEGVHPSRVKAFLKPGTIIKASDREYHVSGTGAWARLEHKPWRNKKEMRQYKRARMASRQGGV